MPMAFAVLGKNNNHDLSLSKQNETMPFISHAYSQWKKNCDWFQWEITDNRISYTAELLLEHCSFFVSLLSITWKEYFVILFIRSTQSMSIYLLVPLHFSYVGLSRAYSYSACMCGFASACNLRKRVNYNQYLGTHTHRTESFHSIELTYD